MSHLKCYVECHFWAKTTTKFVNKSTRFNFKKLSTKNLRSSINKFVFKMLNFLFCNKRSNEMFHETKKREIQKPYQHILWHLLWTVNDIFHCIENKYTLTHPHWCVILCATRLLNAHFGFCYNRSATATRMKRRKEQQHSLFSYLQQK